MAYNKLKTGNDLYMKIGLGDRVLTIDGRPVLQLVSELEAYISASSPAFRSMRAVEKITNRSFMYPMTNYSEYEIESKAVGHTIRIRVPYYFSKQHHRQDAIYYLQALGIESMDQLKLNWDDLHGEWRFDRHIESLGYDPKGPPSGLIGAQTFYEAEYHAEPAIRTGYLVNKGLAYGVLQIFTYNTEKVLAEGGSETLSYFQPIANFLRDVKTSNTPLIIDLRYNGGGDGRYPAMLLSHLARSTERYGHITFSLRVTRAMRQMVEQWDSGQFTNIDDPDFLETTVTALKDAIAKKREHTYAFVPGFYIHPSAEVGGLDVPIAVLTTPNCISACDMQSMLFKKSGRATLIGTHANGTGAGFRTSTPYESTKFIDDYSVFSFSIPNMLFGYPGAPGQITFEEDGAALKYNSENRPVDADVLHEPSINDFLNQGEDWFKEAIKVIEASQS